MAITAAEGSALRSDISLSHGITCRSLRFNSTHQKTHPNPMVSYCSPSLPVASPTRPSYKLFLAAI